MIKLTAGIDMVRYKVRLYDFADVHDADCYSVDYAYPGHGGEP